MTSYNKLINKMQGNLFITFVVTILFMIALYLTIKIPLFRILFISLVIILLLVQIKCFLKFKHGSLLPMKDILNCELSQNVIKYLDCLFTENYIINMHSYWIIAYDDILLIIKKTVFEYDGICTRLYMVTKKKQL